MSPETNRTPALYHDPAPGTHAVHAAFGPGEAIVIVVLAAVLLVVFGPLVLALGDAGSALSEILFMAGLSVLAAHLAARTVPRAERRPLREWLGLTRPPARAVVGALLVGASFWYLNLWLVVPLARHLPGWDQLPVLERAITETSLATLVITVVAIPAVCEEILFRGVLARALHRPLGPVLAAVISAVVFGIFHVLPARWLPTGALGVVLAVVTFRSRSAIPAILVHAVNNAVAVALARGLLAPLSRAVDAHPHAVGAGALMVFGAGLAVLFRSTSRARGFPPREKIC